MSYHVLSSEASHAHSFFDDLESFYYVFCWLVCAYNGPGDIPGSHLKKTPEVLAALDGKDREAKLKHLEQPFDLPVQPWFGDVFRNMMEQLHGLLQRRIIEKDYEPESQRDYKEYLGYLDEAIVKLGPEEAIPIMGDVSKRKLGESEYPIPEQPKRKRAKHVPSIVEPLRRSKRLAKLAMTDNSKRKLGAPQGPIPEIEEPKRKRAKHVPVPLEPLRRSKRLAGLVTAGQKGRRR
jgi:hypothetical protein